MPAAQAGENSCSTEDLTVSHLFGVAGKAVLVTGGGSGIGAMMAAAFVQNGAMVSPAGLPPWPAQIFQKRALFTSPCMEHGGSERE